jgi:outer membrane protein OmpA-like peptidoglycan-associated protein
MSAQPMFEPEDDEAGEHWLSVGDMMAGLMVIFLFIALTYMHNVIEDRDRIHEIAITYEKTKDLIYQRLYEEFKEDLKRWNAELDKETLSVRFKEPDVLFDVGSSALKEQFRAILGDFFPRYIRILADFRDSIEEIRIEGHTSSEWRNGTTPEEGYFKNMALSQDRTRAVLEYNLMLPAVTAERNWIKSLLTANGLSSSKLILHNGKEDPRRSRRVEFRLRTNAEQQVIRILEGGR